MTLRILCLCLLVFSGFGQFARAQTLHLGNGPEPETLDPHRAETVSATTVVRDLYEGLLRLGADGAVLPGVASAWHSSADGLTWTFTLRPDARWSDGSAVTADDFVQGLRRSLDPATASAYAQMLSPLQGAEAILQGKAPPQTLGVVAVAPLQLQLRLARPTAYLLGLLTHPSTYPIHRPSLWRWGQSFAQAGRLVGNGAYTLAAWQPQSEIRLHQNPHYWDAAQVRTPEVVHHNTEDIQAALLRFTAGELHSTYEIPLVQAPKLRRSMPQRMRVSPYLGSYFYGFNTQKPPFDNALLRKALVLAVDREVITQKVMNGLAAPAYGIVAPGTWAYKSPLPAWATWPRAQRLAEARRLYAAAGYGPKRPLRFTFRYNTHEDHRRIAVVVAAMLKQWLGAEMRLVNEEFKVFIGNRNRRVLTQLFRSTWIADYNDASAFLDTLHRQSGQNDSGWVDAEFDQLLAKAANTPNANKRAGWLQAAERRVQTEWPILPIYTYRAKHLLHAQLRGWQDNLLDVHPSRDLWLAAP